MSTLRTSSMISMHFGAYLVQVLHVVLTVHDNHSQTLTAQFPTPQCCQRSCDKLAAYYYSSTKDRSSVGGLTLPFLVSSWCKRPTPPCVSYCPSTLVQVLQGSHPLHRCKGSRVPNAGLQTVDKPGGYPCAANQLWEDLIGDQIPRVMVADSHAAVRAIASACVCPVLDAAIAA